MPNAKAVIGADTPGAIDWNDSCKYCGQSGDNGNGHRIFECAKRFANDHAGHTMPGFDDQGNRVASAWNGANITNDTKAQWRRMKGLGFFTSLPERDDPATMPNMG
eukprot:3936906-Rhodomonas_salina.3